MNPTRLHNLNQTAHIFDSTSHTQMYRPSSPLSSTIAPSTLRSPKTSARIPKSTSSTTPSKPQQNRTQNLHLPGVPRYHPINFQPPRSPVRSAADHSLVPQPLTPMDGQQPLKPAHRQNPRYAEAQMLYNYQRDIQMQIRGGPSATYASPVSSQTGRLQLEPLLSPGDVVTPLELADAGGQGYFAVTAPRIESAIAKESGHEAERRAGK